MLHLSSDVECTFTQNGPTNNLFTITGSYSNSKGTATVNGITYNWCLKMESKTDVAFTISEPMTMTLVFGDNDTNFSIKVDGTAQTGANHQLTTTLEAGTHHLTKNSTNNLFYIGLAAQ